MVIRRRGVTYAPAIAWYYDLRDLHFTELRTIGTKALVYRHRQSNQDESASNCFQVFNFQFDYSFVVH